MGPKFRILGPLGGTAAKRGDCVRDRHVPIMQNFTTIGETVAEISATGQMHSVTYIRH